MIEMILFTFSIRFILLPLRSFIQLSRRGIVGRGRGIVCRGRGIVGRGRGIVGRGRGIVGRERGMKR